MPNWCYNVVTLKGEGLTEFRKTLNSLNDIREEAVFSFTQIVPRPKEEDKNWYEWNIANWGTKWDVADDIIFEDKGDSIIITCETAWSPPLNWATTASSRIPNLTIIIKYREPGVGFCGSYIALNGNSKNVEEEFVDSDDECEVFDHAC